MTSRPAPAAVCHARPGRHGRPRRLAAQDLPPLDSVLTTDPLVTKGTLPNGLTYYIRKNTPPDHRVLLRLAVKTGSVFEGG